MSTPLVLVAMGVDATARRHELDELASVIGATVAYLQGADPSLSAELDRLHLAGAREIRLTRVPVGVAPPARSWLTRVVGHWLSGHPETRVEVLGREVLPTDSLTSPAWERVPAHRHHLLVCRGPRCAAKGADATARAVDAELRARGLGDDDVLVTQTGCLFPCNHAPVVVAHPDDRWFGRVCAGSASSVLTNVLGRTTSAHELPRGTSVAAAMRQEVPTGDFLYEPRWDGTPPAEHGISGSGTEPGG